MEMQVALKRVIGQRLQETKREGRATNPSSGNGETDGIIRQFIPFAFARFG